MPDVSRSSSALPMPPLDLLQRTGNMGEVDPQSAYLEDGRFLRELIEKLLPDDWTWEGKRVLDFGCGAGQVLRQFVADADSAEFWGCDIHGPSIEWVQQNLSPPLQAFTCGEEPGLPQPDGYFDLVFALSVYTHIGEHWAGWLLEHRRVLAPDGLLFATFLGEAMMEQLTGEVWQEDRIGLNALLAGYPWDRGGPITFTSPWWIQEHWGRAFEILELRPYTGGDPSIGEPPWGQGLALMRSRPGELTEADLERPDPEDPREVLALRHHAQQLIAATLDIRRAHDDAVALLEGARNEGRELRSANADLTRRMAAAQAKGAARSPSPTRWLASHLRSRLAQLARDRRR